MQGLGKYKNAFQQKNWTEIWKTQKQIPLVVEVLLASVCFWMVFFQGIFIVGRGYGKCDFEQKTSIK